MHDQAHSPVLLLSTFFTYILAHLTKSELAIDVTIMLGVLGIINYLVIWTIKLSNWYAIRKERNGETRGN